MRDGWAYLCRSYALFQTMQQRGDALLLNLGLARGEYACEFGWEDSYLGCQHLPNKLQDSWIGRRWRAGLVCNSPQVKRRYTLAEASIGCGAVLRSSIAGSWATKRRVVQRD